jgi:hypothetical protein
LTASLGLIAIFVFLAAKSFWDVPTRADLVFLLTWIIYSVFVGMRAKEWLAYDKEQAGWKHVATIESNSAYHAIQAAKQR